MQTPTTDISEIEQLRRRLNETQRSLETHRANLRHELELAAMVHQSLLPKPVHNERIDVDIRYIPITAVGGDYCQVRFSDRDTCHITICDVTGHGIGASLLATRVSSEVRYGILYGRSPREIVRSLNNFICDHFESTGLYLTFFALQIDLRSHRITYSGAGHPPPLLLRNGGKAVEQLDSQNLMIGVQKELLVVQPEHSIGAGPGDRLLIYTDGLIEATNRNGQMLGIAGLAKIASAAMSSDLFNMADDVLGRVARYQHESTADDQTLIVTELK